MQDNQLLGSEKPSYIDFPVKICLTDIGYNFYLKTNKKVDKFRMADNELVNGISFKKITYEYLKSFLDTNYISKLEIYNHDFISKRNELIYLNTLLFNEFVYQKFNSHLLKKFLKTSLIIEWNRKNPKNTITNLTNPNGLFFKNTLIGKEKQRTEYLKSLLRIFINNINNKYIKNERDKKINIAKKILLNLNYLIWFIIIISNNNQNIFQLINDTLFNYIEKTKISEYLSLMIVELINYAENLKLQKYIKMKYRNKKYDLNKLMINKEIRDAIYNSIKNKDDYIYIIWNIQDDNISLRNENKFKVFIMNKDYDYIKLKSDIEDKIKTKEKTLSDFYNESLINTTNSRLGLYYLSYLNEACNEMNIKFKSHVSQTIRNDFPIISLSFKIK